MDLVLWPLQTVLKVTTAPPAPPAAPPTPVQWGPSTMTPNSRLPAPVSPVPLAFTVMLQVKTLSRYLSGIPRSQLNIPVFNHALNIWKNSGNSQNQIRIWNPFSEKKCLKSISNVIHFYMEMYRWKFLLINDIYTVIMNLLLLCRPNRTYCSMRSWLCVFQWC